MAALYLVMSLLSPALGAAEDPSAALLAAHNRVRATVGVPPVRWSTQLAVSALAWADQLAIGNGCTLKHSGPGENLYWASPRLPLNDRLPQTVVNVWAAERQHYDPVANTCKPGRVCGHYTQIVWYDTTTIGCAYRGCGDGGQIWVCQYRPAGNIIGQRPF